MQQLIFNYRLCKRDDMIELRDCVAFDQDDIRPMAQYVLAKITGSRLIEVIEGVDRASYRVDFFGENFMINFEVYSQSCWLESENPQDQSILQRLVPFL